MRMWPLYSELTVQGQGAYCWPALCSTAELPLSSFHICMIYIPLCRALLELPGYVKIFWEIIAHELLCSVQAVQASAHSWPDLLEVPMLSAPGYIYKLFCVSMQWGLYML